MALTVGYLQDGIIQKLGNRGDLLTVLPNGEKLLYTWIKKAVNELTDNYQFEDLTTKGPIIQFTQNVYQYDKKYFTTGNEEWTDIRSWFLWFNTSAAPVDGTATTGTSSALGWNIEGRDLNVVLPMSNVSAIPKYWAQNGDKIIVGMSPNQAYYTQKRYQRKHPWSTPVVPGDTIYMPDSWQEVIEIASALRGAIDKRASDYISVYDNILNGNEDFQRSGGREGKPGLIFGLVSQQQRNKSHNSRQLAPTVSRYGAR